MTTNKEQKVDIPEFLKGEPNKIVTMTEKEYFSKVDAWVHKAWCCGWWKGFKFALTWALIISLGIAYIVFRINSLPDMSDWQDPPISIMAQQ